MRIVRVLETHTHADHLSGHGRFALEHGVPVSIHPQAQPEYPFDPLEDGQVLQVGAVDIRVVHTPGHRPEHCAFVVDDELVSDRRLAVRRRRGAPGSRDRRTRGSGRPFSLAPAPHRPPGRRRRLSRACGGVALRLQHEPRAVDVDRPREGDESRPADNRARGVRRRVGLGLDAAAADHRAARRPQPRPVGRSPRAARARRRRGRAPGPRRAADRRLRVGHAPVRSASPSTAARSPRARRSCSTRPSRSSCTPARPPKRRRRLDTCGRSASSTRWALPDRRSDRATADDHRPSSRACGGDDAAGPRRPGGRRARSGRARLACDPLPARCNAASKPGTLDPARPVYTICESGQRATLAASVLNRQGYDARAVVGGGVGDLAAYARVSARL